MDRKLYRSDVNKVFAGVCGGLGEYFGMDPVIVRLAFVLAVFIGGASGFIYLIAWIIIPRRPYGLEDQAIHTGTATNTGNVNPPQPAVFSSSSNMMRYLPGIILVAVGAILLIRQTLYWFSWHQFLPAALIVIGIVIIVRSITGEKKSGDQFQPHV